MAISLRWRDPATRLSVEDWRQAARRRLPRLAWNYVDGGADDEVTLAANVSGFRRWRLRQRVLTGASAPDLATAMIGETLALPLALAPTGGAGLSHWSGDPAAHRAAEAAGSRAVLSTASVYTLEEVARATQRPQWFQLYPFGDRARVGALLKRAKDAGYSALFVTVDVPVLGNREGERKSGMTAPWTMTPGRLLNMATRPRWVQGVMRHGRLAPIHYREPQPDGSPPPRPTDLLRGAFSGQVFNAAADAAWGTEALQRYMQGDLHWDDLAWMRDQWQGPLYVKGVLDPDDAAKAIDELGATGVVVSNHGGRQLDRTLASIEALPAIVDRVGGRGEVLFDGGVRRGTDVITALALGATGVMIGRPYLYGLAVSGEAGVAAILEIFRREIARALVLMGCPGAAALDRSWVIGEDRR
jgi:isopentenyl diphosphate isomerase/L-lactate dehydrogenase-like FMN-dependent dehydrogenase